VSHRAAGSTIDQVRPMARLAADYFKGTGTSQAAAVVSGIAARMFDANPALTPDEAKAALVGTAHSALRGRSGAGAGLVDAAAAVEAARTDAYAGATQALRFASGLGKLDSSRGGYKPYTDFKERGKPEQLSGEYSALGRSWDASAWASRPWRSPADWRSAEWAPYTAVSAGWEPAGWATAWSGLGWDEASWAGRRWGDAGAPDTDWSGRRWGASAWN
jgi:serine protease AprX